MHKKGIHMTFTRSLFYRALVSLALVLNEISTITIKLTNIYDTHANDQRRDSSKSETVSM